MCAVSARYMTYRRKWRTRRWWNSPVRNAVRGQAAILCNTICNRWWPYPAVWRWGQDKIHVGTIGEIGDDEETVIARFFELIETHTPQLVSWNGGGFDLPVLHYRALIHGITAARYWDMGEGDFGDSRDFKWNNYISRYHNRHCDLMDLLALYQPRANVPLDDMAKLCGFPGKLGMDGGKVWQAFHEGRLKEIRDYCETDAANTYLMYLRFRLMSGALDGDEYEQEIRRLKNYLQTLADGQEHWCEFLAAWG